MQRPLVSVTKKMAEWLQSESERRGCPVSQVIRDLIAKAMEGR